MQLDGYHRDIPQFDPTVYYSVDQLAKLWQVNPASVYAQIRKGRLKAFKIGVSWRISDQARDEYERRCYTGKKGEKWI